MSINNIKVVIERRMPDELLSVLKSIGYWNEQGFTDYENNKKPLVPGRGQFGSDETRKDAASMTYQDWAFKYLLIEIEKYAEDKENWPNELIFGKSGSHIWVSDVHSRRILLIHF